MRGEVLVGDGLWRRVEVLGPFDGEWPELVSAAGLVEVVLGALGSLMLVVPVPVFKVHLTEYRFVDGLAQMTRSSRLGQRLTYRRARRLRRTACTSRRAAAPSRVCARSGRRSYDQRVAYDEDLAARVRQLLSDEPDLTEKKMFGGLAFLVGGNMAVAASGQGGLLVRVDPETTEALLARTKATPMEMRGRAMTGWLRVEAADVKTKRQLAQWVDRGVGYARALPSKR